MGGVEEPAGLGLRLWHAFQAHDWKSVESMLHQQAQIESAAKPGVLLDRAQAIELWRREIGQGRYLPQPLGFVAIDSERVLIVGVFNPATLEGDADALILSFRDGLLWRSTYYESAEQARAAAELP